MSQDLEGEPRYQYLLNYVGKNVYSIESFVAEAMRLGARRGISGQMLKRLKWGQPILLAFWNSSAGGNLRNGVATVFGYFTVDRVSLANISDELRETLTRQMRVTSNDSSGKGTVVRRGCGSYIAGEVYSVEEEISEIVEKAEEIAANMGVKLKWFIEGRFHPLSPIVEVVGIPFTRSYLYVWTNGELGLLEPEKKLAFVYQYQRRRYAPVTERTTLSVSG